MRYIAWIAKGRGIIFDIKLADSTVILVGPVGTSEKLYCERRSIEKPDSPDTSGWKPVRFVKARIFGSSKPSGLTKIPPKPKVEFH